MSASIGSDGSQPSDAWRVHEQILEAFEEAWRVGERPEIDAYLAEVSGRRRLLIELILSDIEFRVRTGSPWPVETYLDRYSELAEDYDAVSQLVQTEVRVRTQAGCPRPDDEYSRLGLRFGPAFLRLFETGRGGHPSPDHAPLESGPTNDWKTRADLLDPFENVDLTISEVDRYQRSEVIGSGGMGVVYRVHDQVLDRDLAMKVLRESCKDSPEAQRRLIREARITGQLQHPNIVPVHELGRFRPPDEGVYFIMRLVQGRTFADHLREIPLSGRTQALSIFLKICQAVAYAHKVGVIHRDLKPANVMVGAFGEVQVMDWGFAKVLATAELPIEESQNPSETGPSPISSMTTGSNHPETQHGSVIGTPAFMAPEQARGQIGELDERTDVFGLGAILCQILTDRPPYLGTQNKALKAAANADLDDAFACLREQPDQELAAIAIRCLAPEKADRFLDAGHLSDEIERYMTTREERILKERAEARERLQQERAEAEARLNAEREASEARLRKERTRRWMTLAAAIVAVASILLGAQWRAYRTELAEKRDWASQELDQGRAFAKKGDHVKAQEVLDGLLRTLQDDWRFSDVEAKAREVRDMSSLAVAKEKAADEEMKADREWYADFARRREDAFLSYSMFRDDDSYRWASDVASKSRHALAGAGYHEGKARWDGPPRTGRTLSDEERKGIPKSVLALLLILSDVESSSGSGKALPGQVNGTLASLNAAAELQKEYRTQSYVIIRKMVADRIGGVSEVSSATPRAVEKASILNEYDDYLMGQVEYRRGSTASAVGHLKMTQRNQPSRRIWTQFLLAKCFLKLDRIDEARAELDECIRSRPDLAWSYMLRGAAIDRSLRMGNRSRGSLYQEAEDDFRQALAKTSAPGDRAVIYYARHSHWLLSPDPQGNGPDLEKAARDLEEARRLSNGQWITPYLSLADVRHKMGHDDQSEATLAEASKRFPDSPLPHRRLAQLVLEEKTIDRNRACRELDASVRLENNARLKARDLVIKARVLSEKGDFSAAAETSDQALRFSRGDRVAYLCKLEALLGAKRYDEADTTSREALALGHRSSLLFEVHGLLLARRKDYPAAIEAYTNALTLDPGRTSILLVRGWSYLATNAPRMALPDFEKALKIGGASAEVHCGLGAANVALRRYREALDHARAAMDAQPRPTFLTCYRVACIHAQASELTRDLDAVRQHLDKAQSLLVEASSRLPATKQGSFWREIDKDPGLMPLRRRPGYAEWFPRPSSMGGRVASTVPRSADSPKGSESLPVLADSSSRLSSGFRTQFEVETERLRVIESSP